MAVADLIDISRWSAGAVALFGLGLAVLLTAMGYGIAWSWRRFIDPRRKG